MSDLYSQLDLTKDAAPTAEQIKRAYRKKAKQAHPDTPTGSAESFQRLTRAYLVLSDPARRSKYDATGDIDEGTIDNTLSQAVSIVIGMVMAAVDNYVKGNVVDPSSVDLVDHVKIFVKKQVAGFEEQKRQMEKAQASLRDIAKRWTPLARVKSAKGSSPRGSGARFLKAALDQQAVGTEEPLRKINQQIETYKLALELLANSSFDPADAGLAQRYKPTSRTWTTTSWP